MVFMTGVILGLGLGWADTLCPVAFISLTLTLPFLHTTFLRQADTFGCVR